MGNDSGSASLLMLNIILKIVCGILGDEGREAGDWEMLPKLRITPAVICPFTESISIPAKSGSAPDNKSLTSVFKKSTEVKNTEVFGVNSRIHPFFIGGFDFCSEVLRLFQLSGNFRLFSDTNLSRFTFKSTFESSIPV